ncbi:MAG: aminotransferase class V-fold PLP-dependent enzyme [Candidatus Dormibacteria bacterium]
MATYAGRFLESMDERPVDASTDRDELRRRLGGTLAEQPTEPGVVLRELIAAAEDGIVASGAGRFFGFVVGGSLPAAVGADWLATTWDQNAGLFILSPAASVVEEVAAEWIKQLLGLPTEASVGFVTGCQMAHFTCLAAARYHVLAQVGWDVEQRGLASSPQVRVLAGRQRHVTIDRALRFLGLGTDSLELIDVDGQGRMLPRRLSDALQGTPVPTIVCAQAGEVNTGAFDPIAEICQVAHGAGAWVHVDGAFGIWAAASARLRHLVVGLEQADSWATDCHKWLNVPYDSGLAICAHPESHRAAMTAHAAYLIRAESEQPRDEVDWVPEFSRRARGFAVYAGLRSLGRAGLAAMVEGCSDHASRMAARLAEDPEIEILNDVHLNQVLFRVRGADGDGRTQTLAQRVRDGGVCWLSGTSWEGRPAVRVSVTSWRTTAADVDHSAASILAAARP